MNEPLKFKVTPKIRNKLLDKEVRRIMEGLGLLHREDSKVLQFELEAQLMHKEALDKIK